VKKCASCTKDLPDAALHCVFCGARQPPAPAVQQGMAKTAFGYSANDAIDQMRLQNAQQGRPLPPTAQAPAYNPQQQPRPAPMAPSRPAPMAPPMAPPRPPMAQPQPYPPGPTAGPPGGFVPASPANAATMFAPAASPSPQAQLPTMQPPPPSYNRPNAPAAMLPTLVPSPPPPLMQQPPPRPQPQLQPQPPIMQIPAAQPPPYLASNTASRTIRPVEPWRNSLRLMMFLWGVALLAAFAAPLRTSPDLAFNWNLILDGEGTARLPPLMLAAVGFLSVIVAAIPMPPAARGAIAAILGLAGIAVPIALTGMPEWQALISMIGMLLLVPGLLVRNEYRDAITARLLVTLGAIGILVPYLLPQGGAIPLVHVFKQLIELPGTGKVAPALEVGRITVVVMSLLAWLSPSVTGGAKLWAWLLILWALFVHVAVLLLAGHVVDAVTGAPNATIVSWVAGGSPVAIGSAYLVLVGYGLASVVGKQLE
jgi:hypothetical protein